VKIISKFKDFYDGAGQYTDTPLYLRETKELDPPEAEEPWCIAQRGKRQGEYNKRFLIGFCGKMYPMVRRSVYKDDIRLSRKFLYTLDEYMEGRDKKKEKRSWRHWWTGKQDRIEDFYSSDHQEYTYLFHQHKVPVFVTQNMVLNPVLVNIEFYKVFNSYSAYQEIEMFISGVLGTKENDMIDIDDKYRIESHGFDKHSFRMPKGRKKPRGKSDN